MKCIIFLHSTTGNTRLVARFAARRLEQAGHVCTVHNIVRAPEPPDMDDVDLIGVACPTMYFRGTMAMEQFISRLPVPGGPRPAFLLATAGGDPGSHFVIQARQLRHLDWIVLGARFVPFADNWPPHRALFERIPLARPVATTLHQLLSGLLGKSLTFLWPDLQEPEPRHREELARFIDDVARRAATGEVDTAPAPGELFVKSALTGALGRIMTVKQMRRVTAIRVSADRCSACGICVEVCPVGCLSRAGDDAVPAAGAGCTGCWACYNHCPDGAISGWTVKKGLGRYHGPSSASRELFRG